MFGNEIILNSSWALDERIQSQQWQDSRKSLLPGQESVQHTAPIELLFVNFRLSFACVLHTRYIVLISEPVEVLGYGLWNCVIALLSSLFYFIARGLLLYSSCSNISRSSSDCTELCCQAFNQNTGTWPLLSCFSLSMCLKILVKSIYILDL